MPQHNNSEFQEAMLERQQRVEEAIERAEKGIASAEDFDIIRFECNCPKYKLPYVSTALDDLDNLIHSIFRKQ
jgi:hypothetical protein